MRLIVNNDNRDPHLNLALEEYCVRHLDMAEPYLLLYVNDPAVIVGKHQNVLEEVNLPFVRRRGIAVVRRISGGGAVYHDHGNLNFSFIRAFARGEFIPFEEFTRPVVRALADLGVPARAGKRNDITVDGGKISGNAQFTTVHSMLSHGTLLFDSRLDDLEQALSRPAARIESRAVQSVRSPVVNISAYLRHPVHAGRFREHLLDSIWEGQPVPQYHLTSGQWDEVRALADSRYRTWDWNYGMSPQCTVRRTARLAGEEVEVRIEVDRGRIQAIRGPEALASLSRILGGIRYDPDSIRTALEGADLPQPDLDQVVIGLA